MKLFFQIIALFAFFFAIFACNLKPDHNGIESDPTNTPTFTSSGTASPTPTPTNSATDTPTSTPTGYTVIYDGNGNTDGAVPVDAFHYTQGQTVTVMGNTGKLIKINVTGVSYRFVGWNSQADGNGTTYGPNFTMGTANIILFAKWVAYQVRDSGPAAGLICYDKGSYDSGWRYLEAAPSSTEWVSKLWSDATDLVGAAGLGIGSGQANTSVIVLWLAGIGETDRAAQLCDSLSYNGYSDWFLPSRDELSLMYSNLKVHSVGGFSSDNYWSSSENSNVFSWYQTFTSPDQVGGSKWFSKRVRAIRAF